MGQILQRAALHHLPAGTGGFPRALPGVSVQTEAAEGHAFKEEFGACSPRAGARCRGTSSVWSEQTGRSKGPP